MLQHIRCSVVPWTRLPAVSAESSGLKLDALIRETGLDAASTFGMQEDGLLRTGPYNPQGDSFQAHLFKQIA